MSIFSSVSEKEIVELQARDFLHKSAKKEQLSFLLTPQHDCVYHEIIDHSE
jgi:hypothetical protein